MLPLIATTAAPRPKQQAEIIGLESAFRRSRSPSQDHQRNSLFWLHTNVWIRLESANSFLELLDSNVVFAPRYNFRLHGGPLVSAAASQQKGHQFESEFLCGVCMFLLCMLTCWDRLQPPVTLANKKTSELCNFSKLRFFIHIIS